MLSQIQLEWDRSNPNVFGAGGSWKDMSKKCMSQEKAILMDSRIPRVFEGTAQDVEYFMSQRRSGFSQGIRVGTGFGASRLLAPPVLDHRHGTAQADHRVFDHGRAEI